MFKHQVQILTGAAYNVTQERTQLQEFLQQNNLETDPRFIESISAGDIIEVYSVPENLQIYQNQEFLKICSYTPEQMSTIPFPKLFWRADETHVELMRRASHVMKNEKGCVPWDLDSHELVESLHPRKRTFEMSMGQISPCFDLHSKLPKAWASTLKVTLVFEWQENLA
jgi:hypothetical protein